MDLNTVLNTVLNTDQERNIPWVEKYRPTNLNDIDKLLRNAQELGNAINGESQPRPGTRSANNARPRRSPNMGELRRQLSASPQAGNRRRSA